MAFNSLGLPKKTLDKHTQSGGLYISPKDIPEPKGRLRMRILSVCPFWCGEGWLDFPKGDPKNKPIRWSLEDPMPDLDWKKHPQYGPNVSTMMYVVIWNLDHGKVQIFNASQSTIQNQLISLAMDAADEKEDENGEPIAFWQSHNIMILKEKDSKGTTYTCSFDKKQFDITDEMRQAWKEADIDLNLLMANGSGEMQTTKPENSGSHIPLTLFYKGEIPGEVPEAEAEVVEEAPKGTGKKLIPYGEATEDTDWHDISIDTDTGTNLNDYPPEDLEELLTEIEENHPDEKILLLKLREATGKVPKEEEPKKKPKLSFKTGNKKKPWG